MSLNPAYIDAGHLLMKLYAQQQGQWAALQEVAQNTLKLVSGDPATLAALNRSSNMAAQLAAAAVRADAHPTAEGYLNLSLQYRQA